VFGAYEWFIIDSSTAKHNYQLEVLPKKRPNTLESKKVIQKYIKNFQEKPRAVLVSWLGRNPREINM